MRIIQILESASVGGMSTGSVATAPSKAGKMIKRQDNILAAEGEKTMSRAAKGNEKYGKDGMKALAKAGREGASDKKLDAIRDKHDNYNEDSDPCWKDYKQIGMKKKGGKQVPNCVPKESAVAEVAPPGWEKTVKSMKKHDEIDNPYALAWSMKNKGYKSHKKESIKEGGVKEIIMDLRTMSDEEFQSTYKMSKMQARSKLKEKPVEENKKGVRAVKHTVKPRNFVAKNAVQSGAGAHKDKKKAQKQGDTKHKNKEPAYESRLWAALDRKIIK